MPAKDYKLAVSPLTGTIYIAKVSKLRANEMTDDRVVVDKSNFIACLLEWTQHQLSGSNTLSITHNGKVIAEVKITDHNEPNSNQSSET